MSKISVTAMLTCFNRKEYTLSCLTSLVDGNPNISFRFIITDDSSSDGTPEALQGLDYDVVLLSGNGQLFWNGGMTKALQYALDSGEKTDYYMLINDDVRFYEHSIEELIARQRPHPECVVAGATTDSNGNTSYGGIRLLSKHFVKFAVIEPSKEYVLCDTFNGNCVLLPQDIFFRVGNVDPLYRHSMSDFDYGMKLRRLGIDIYNSEKHVGSCNDNDISGCWRDTSLSRKVRLQKKESPKGLPKKDWYHFVRKNYGLLSAVYHSITPYIRIILGK